MPDLVALIVVVPARAAVASPLLEYPLLTNAMFLFEEVHFTDLVKSCVTPPVKDPVAVNCCFELTEMLGLTGVTTIACSVALITVSVVLPVMAPNLAVIVEEPRLTPVARPEEFDALLITTTAVFEELHVTCSVRSCTEVSENIPVAVNCWLNFRPIVALEGVTTMDCNVADVTVRLALLETMLPAVACTVVDPTAVDIAKPLVSPPALLMTATERDVELQVTESLMSRVELSLYVPIALYCWDVPRAMLEVAGVMAIDISVADVTVSVALPAMP